MAILTWLINDNPKMSMRYLLSYVMTPEAASHFTLLDTSSKIELQKCRFYECIRSKNFVFKTFRSINNLVLIPIRQ